MPVCNPAGTPDARSDHVAVPDAPMPRTPQNSHADADRARSTITVEPAKVLRFEELLRELGTREPLTVGELVAEAGATGFGLVLGVLSVVAIAAVGLSTPFGLAIALLGVQLAVGRARPWLPRWARRRPLSAAMIDRAVAMVARRTRWLAKITRERWQPVLATRPIGLGVLVLALGLMLPLPIPGSNAIFAIPLVVYAIGLVERDGAWVAVGHLLAAVDALVLVVLGDAIERALVAL